MRNYMDIALCGQMSLSRKCFLVFLAVLIIIAMGVLTAFLVDKNNEFQRNNFGVYDITLSNSGTTISNGGKATREYTNIKIGQKERLKFGFKLSSYARTVTTETEEGESQIISNVKTGVYVKMVVTGEVYDIKENGIRAKNDEYCKILKNVIESSCFALDSWDKYKNEFIYCSSRNKDDQMRIGEGEEYYSNSEIVMYFNSSIVDGSWWDKIVVLNFQLIAVDCLSSEGNNWKLR